MYIKFVVFYTIVFCLKSVLSGVNLKNDSNIRNTHQLYLKNEHNAESGQITNRHLIRPSIAGNDNRNQPYLRQHNQNVKFPFHNASPLLPFRQPMNTVHRRLNPNDRTLLSNERFEHFHNNGNKFTATSQRYDKNIINNIKGQTQNILRQENNRHNDAPEKIVPVVEHNIVRTLTELVGNESKKLITPSTLPRVQRLPRIEPNNLHTNKLLPHTNNALRSVTNLALNRQNPAINNQNIFRHKGNTPQQSLQNPRSNTQINQNKRFAVVHDNGFVEYFDHLELILRKYPHIRITNNIRKLIPNQKPKVPQPNNSDSLLNTNIKPSGEHSNILNKNLLPRITMHALNTTQKPKIENNNQKKDISLINRSNLQTLPNKACNKQSGKPEILTKEVSVKRMNTNEHDRIMPINSQEKKIISNITMTENPKDVMTKPSDVFSKNNQTTATENINPINAKKQKPPIDVILNSDKNIPNKVNISTVISNNKYENYQNVTGELKNDDLHLNNTKGAVSPSILQKNKHVNATSENKREIMNSSLSNHDTVGQSTGTQSNCTKENKFKNKQKPPIDVILNSDSKTKTEVIVRNQTDKRVDDEYDEDLLSLTKPLMWFSTTDPEFWKKLVSVDEGPNFLYIINVQSQPKIERDRKTTIHPNGTIVEEITETIWNAGDDEPPTITKTIKVIPADAATDAT